MSELQEVNIEEELSKSENEDVPILSIQTDPLETQKETQKETQQETQQELLSSLIQGSPSKETEDPQPSLEEGEIPEDPQSSLEEGEIPEDSQPSLEEGEIPEEPMTVQLSENIGTYLQGDQNELDSDEDSSDEEESIIYKNLEEDIDINILKFYHPETENINYKELLTLSKITKNKRGEIIDPFHKTIPFITQYEKAKILGQRAKQINHGSTPFVDIPSNIIDGHTIALMELNQKKIPFIIRRPLPNGTSEYWKVKDLKIIL